LDTKIARNRAELSGKLTNVLDSRSLESSHKRLAGILTEGMTVLDVGCGTGAITKGIAEAVGPKGLVIGIDNNPSLIEKARKNHGETPELSFEVCDSYKIPYEQQFDIVTASRLLIWLSDPFKALKMMTSAAKIGGRILIVDYNHEKISWEPQPPSSMLNFYSAYLKWRSGAGMDNSIADNLPEMFEKVGLKDITITPHHEVINRKATDFQTRIGIWADTASSRGPQMERDGFTSKRDYLNAEKEYREWTVQDAQSLTMYMLGVEGIRVI
jgi:ubiquinone/menaquinone biosynthesis C-methylase UbiE